MATRVLLKPLRTVAALLGILAPTVAAWRRFEGSRRYRELAPKPLSPRDCPCLGDECPSMGRRLKGERVSRYCSSVAYRCARCHLVYFDPQPDAATLTEFYSAPGDAGYAALLRGWTARDLTEGQRLFCRQKLERLEQEWRKAAPDAGKREPRFVEIGIGNAHLLAVARDELGWKVQGIDVSHPLAAEARLGFGLDIIERDLSVSGHTEGLPSNVDIVLAEHTLEHTRHPGQVLRNIAVMLAPGGIAAVMVPNGQSLEASRNFSRWAWGNYPVHLYFFTRQAFELSFEAAGMICESFDSTVYNEEGKKATEELLRSVLGLSESADAANYLPAMRDSLLLPEFCVVARKPVGKL